MADHGGAAYPFTKMHGLGNDFVIIDARAEPWLSLAASTARAYPVLNEDGTATAEGTPDVVLPAVSADLCAALSDRHRGIGCDNVIVLHAPSNDATGAVVRTQIVNVDGREVESCGNATRCVAWLEAAKQATVGEPLALPWSIETRGGLVAVTAMDGTDVTVDMGRAKVDWADIPLSRPLDAPGMLDIGRPLVLDPPPCVNMGNPHVCFFVDGDGDGDGDGKQSAVASFGAAVETHELFPENVNVGLAWVVDEGTEASLPRLRLDVWERSVGLTAACGTGACAAAVAALDNGLIAGAADAPGDASGEAVAVAVAVRVTQRGGDLVVTVTPDRRVLMCGATAVSFEGSLAPGSFDGLA